MGRAPLTSLLSDSQALHPVTWVVADFHSIVPDLPFPAILFPVQDRKSCLQLFPALRTEGLFEPQTHTHTHPNKRTHKNCKHTSSSLALPLGQGSGWPSLMWRWPPGIMGWSHEHVGFPACAQGVRVQSITRRILQHIGGSSVTRNVCDTLTHY